MRNSVIAACVALLTVLGLVQTAYASTSSCQTDQNGETTCVSLSQYAKSSSSATATGAVRVNTAAKVEGEFISATGFHPSHAKAHYIRVGTWYQNSFRNRDGHIQYFTDRCGDGSPYTHPLTSGPHKGFCMFYWDSKLKVWRKPDCGNFVKFPGPMPKLTFKSVMIFKTFAEIKWNVTVRLNEAGKAYATASAKAPGCYAASSAWAKGKGYVDVHVFVYAKYSYKAKLIGPGHVTAKQKLQAQVVVKANITVSVRATATAWCQVSTPPPPPQEHPEASINAKNDVDVTDTATVCAPYNVPGSDTATLMFNSQFGSYPASLGGATFTVSGSGTQCTEYKAPSEVPSGGKDTLSVAIRDNQTGLSDDTPSDNSTPITINPTPPPPA